MDARDDWTGALTGVPRGVATRSLAAPIRTSGSGAQAFLSLTEDGSFFWVKTLGNPQGDQILVTEQIVAAAGQLIGAPVRSTALIDIPRDFDGYEYAPLCRLRPGIAHGSLALDPVEESDLLEYRNADDNARRQALFVALWDWCLGEDEQWLYDLNDDRSIWSFDHGLWLAGETGWTGDQLALIADRPWDWQGSVSGMDPTAFHDAANRLEALTESDILSAVAVIPESWGVAQAELETVAWVLHRRRVGVAHRLRLASAHV